MVDARKQTETQTTTVGETKIPKRKKKSYFFPCCILSHSKTSTTYSKLLHKNIRKIKKMLLKKKILRLVFLISGFFFFFFFFFPSPPSFISMLKTHFTCTDYDKIFLFFHTRDTCDGTSAIAFGESMEPTILLPITNR